ncbi:cytochrome P450 709B3-like isoform X2 [Miscanthus floridulus]|uniref:cytochrome P450 709B3-like isoform X2 n=1 Tax=Miscanthus floridulus TaxID=154761 RepID=UPI00345A03D8
MVYVHITRYARAYSTEALHTQATQPTSRRSFCKRSHRSRRTCGRPCNSHEDANVQLTTRGRLCMHTRSSLVVVAYMGADQWLWPWAPPPPPLLLALWRRLVWQPRALAQSFARQGIRGPPYRFLAGSLPEVKRLALRTWTSVAMTSCLSCCLPPFHRWVVEYGRTFLYWIGPTPAIFSVDLELIKEVLTDRSGLFAKDFMIPVFKVLLGNGLILANGDDWKRHRKVVLPAFNHDRIKSMSAVTAEATEQMARRWCEQILNSGARQAAEIQVDLTAEIIGRAAFGTSHQEAGEVLVLMHEMQKMGAAAMLDGPILWHLPTRRNLTVRRLDKLLRSKITAMMAARVAAANCGGGYGDDLLGLLLEAWSPEPERQAGSDDDEGTTTTLTTGEVIDECKTFFGAGQETTATLLVWTVFLLSTHPQWQDKVREEVLREFPGGDGDVPNSDTLSRLKLLHMVLLETLRLYPPIVYIQRTTASDVVLRGIEVPGGTVISIPIGLLQRDREVWGSDADEFNPLRFSNGVARAAMDPHALLSFSLGPRACTGKSFGIIEAQIVMAVTLRKFTFSLSPTYVHKPKYVVSLTPKCGMPLIFKSLHG